MSDWTGNKKTVFSIMGATNHSERERESNDYYATDPEVIDLLLAKYDIPTKVWECACGSGHLSERLKELGKDVVSTDLIDRGYGEVQNFFEALEMPEGCECILTNPPYKYATEFVLHAMDLLPVGGKAVFFLKTTFLETERRYQEIFRFTPPHFVFQFIRRAMCAKNGDFEEARKVGSAVSYAFFVWEKGYKGQTIIDWV